MDKIIDPFFPPAPSQIPWQGIEAVRQEVLGKKKLHMNHSLLRLEENFIDQTTYFTRVEDFIQICEDSEHVRNESVMLLIILAKLYYAELLINAGQPNDADGLLNWVNQKIVAGFLINGESARGVHYVRFYGQLKHIQRPPARVQESVEKVMGVAKEAERDRDLLMEISTFVKIFGVFNDITRAEWTRELSHLQDQCQKRYLYITSHGNVGALFENAAITRLGLKGAHHGEVEEFFGNFSCDFKFVPFSIK
jgi:hypothetical protein